MAGLNFSTNFGELAINGISMHTAAWTILDVRPLYTPATTPRGKNVIIPNSVGKLIRAIRTDENKYSLPMAISGEVAIDGVTLNSDIYQGLWDNVAYLDAQLCQGTETNNFLAATLTSPDTITQLTADVQVLDIKLGTGPAKFVRATLDMIVVPGRFT